MKRQTKVPVGAKVRIGDPIDNALDSSFKGDDGVVIKHWKHDAKTMHEVKFGNGAKESYYAEELIQLNG